MILIVLKDPWSVHGKLSAYSATSKFSLDVATSSTKKTVFTKLHYTISLKGVVSWFKRPMNYNSILHKPKR